MKKFVKKIVNYLKNFIKYIRKGGITYIEINQIHSEEMLKDKNIIITGGTSGIGYTIAKKCIDLGAKVIVTGRDIQKLEQVKKELNCEIIHPDIIDINMGCPVPKVAITSQAGSALLKNPQKVKEIVEILNGKIDCFVNNAGIYKSINYNNCNKEDWDKIMNTNLTGLYFATNEIVTQCFEKNNKGNIVNIASIAGMNSNIGPYGISKSGVIHYTKGLAKQLLNKNIRVNGINPGVTVSNINPIDDDNIYMEQVPGKRMILAEEIADIVVFLISDSSSCITGQIITCDNGATLIA